jgi:hypothetical protein
MNNEIYQSFSLQSASETRLIYGGEGIDKKEKKASDPFLFEEYFKRCERPHSS